MGIAAGWCGLIAGVFAAARLSRAKTGGTGAPIPTAESVPITPAEPSPPAGRGP